MAALPSPNQTFFLQRLGTAVAARLTVNPHSGSALLKAGPVYFLEEACSYRFVVSEEWVQRHHSVAASALVALESVALANNGHADIGDSAVVAHELERMGYTVIRSLTLHGLPTFRAFTPRAQDALRSEPFAQSTYKHFSPRLDEPDYEAAILASQGPNGGWL